MKIKDSALKALIAEVEAEIGTLLKSEGEKLAKAADSLDEKAEEMKDKQEENSPAAEAPSEDPSAEDSAEASAPMGDKAPEAEASPEASADEEKEQSPEEQSPEEASKDEMQAQQGEEMNPEALKAEYMKLSPDELEMHFMAAKSAMEMLMGQHKDAPAQDKAAPAPAMKAEEKDHKEHKEHKEHKDKEHKDLDKSEKITITNPSDERLKELEAQVEGLVKALDLALGQPMRKAVTSVAFVPRTEEAKAPLNKSEVVEKLKEITKQPLKKSDRELINRYCLGEVEVDKIQHLLQEK